MLEQKAVEMAVKHIVARSTKRFFGYGPAEKVTVVVQGDVVIFATRFSGPGILEALPSSPFGRLAMRHIAEIFSREVAQELVSLAGEQFGVGLKAILSDLDFESGQSLGIALLEKPLPPLDRPADAELAGALTRVLAGATGAIAAPASVGAAGTSAGSAGSPATVRVGPAAIIIRAPALLFPEGETAEAEFAALAARDRFRTRFRAGLVAGLASRGLAVGAVFAVNSRAGLVAGALLEGATPGT